MEHFIPERLGEGHPFVLGPGVVCDSCNGWASRTVDRALIEREELAVWLTRLRIRGKRGRLGAIRTSSMSFAPDSGSVSWSRRAETEKPSADWKRADLLGRSLTRSALGALFRSNPELALHDRVAEARVYMREGNRTGHHFMRALGRWVEPAVGLAVATGESQRGELFAKLQLHLETFWVPLEGTLTLPRTEIVPGLKSFMSGGISSPPQRTELPPTLLVLEGDEKRLVGRLVSPLPGIPAEDLPAHFRKSPLIQEIHSDMPLWRNDFMQDSPVPWIRL